MPRSNIVVIVSSIRVVIRGCTSPLIFYINIKANNRQVLKLWGLLREITKAGGCTIPFDSNIYKSFSSNFIILKAMWLYII
jgi:hypothetical protein